MRHHDGIEGESGPPPVVPRGRGAAGNPAGRFERWRVLPVDDGGAGGPGTDGSPRTEVREERARTIISRNDSPDVPFDRSINPYRGCEHGCSYCFARPTHSFLGLSPGLDFESRLVAKTNAAELLRAELSRPGYTCRPVNLGANTDPYQPVERSLGLTRRCLEVLVATGHPVTVVTKSHLVVRDIDLLSELAKQGKAAVFVSVTTFEERLVRAMEPRASHPRRRLRAMERLSEAGIPVGLLASPMIPGLNDWELERLLEAGSLAGARHASYILLRLPHELKSLFTDWLAAHFPGRADKVMSHLRRMHGGAIYDPRFDRRGRGRGPLAELLRKRFEVGCRRYGLEAEAPALSTDGFRPPAIPGRTTVRMRQASLF